MHSPAQQTSCVLTIAASNATDSPARVNLFNQIAHFVHERVSSSSSDSHDGPTAKRRRVDVDQTPIQTQSNGHASGRVSTAGAASEQVLLEVRDISVAAPQRKKYTLCFTKNFLFASAAGTASPVEGIVYPWTDIGTLTPPPSPPLSFLPPPSPAAFDAPG